ncbi:GLPGLI family protein [Chryseobacterium gotjawalense]|uniref:GLPGLI family protein n=1 Tax=Chryseobacterium gotjawalense TaxID=3042315 RepID=A0ABY8RFW1_9FLAO|nr:GLPGLI family protein [Chryseobacterium sp. wdc7]WHF52594.1 GLPGLI family protein [Chryseobacterium sp. wdc7]
MRNKLLFILFLIVISYNAQTKRFIYDVEYKKDSTSNVKTKENYHLDINGKAVDYYTRDYFIADSLIVNNIPFPETLKLKPSSIVTHIIGFNNFEEYDLLENTIINLKSKDLQSWTLTNETKVVKTLNLQKAQTYWGGRHWTAWFTEEIPFQVGPYKFHGLPGLIVELFDDNGNYKFELVNSQNLKNNAENQYLKVAKQRSVPVNWEKYKNTKLKYYQSPIDFIKNAKGSSQKSEFFLNDGTIVNPNNSREINKTLRQAIKKFNNPINLDSAIQYD